MHERADQSAAKGRRRGSGRRAGQGMSAQLASTRRRAIGSMVAERGALTVTELAACFGVSSMTVRHALAGLEQEGLISAERGLAGAMTRFFALAEAYPDLKADSNMRQLSEELTSTENRVAFARQSYNDAVTSYNTARESFPANLIAGSFGFAEAPLLLIENETERQAPRVSF